MKLKGLAETKKKILAMQEVLEKKIDDLYDESPQWEAKDEFYNAAWIELDQALERINDVIEMKLEHYI